MAVKLNKNKSAVRAHKKQTNETIESHHTQTHKLSELVCFFDLCGQVTIVYTHTLKCTQQERISQFLLLPYFLWFIGNMCWFRHHGVRSQQQQDDDGRMAHVSKYPGPVGRNCIRYEIMQCNTYGVCVCICRYLMQYYWTIVIVYTLYIVYNTYGITARTRIWMLICICKGRKIRIFNGREINRGDGDIPTGLLLPSTAIYSVCYLYQRQ